jgi:hypothetical protein
MCTQPRRISAITVSERVAAERGERIGEGCVGYQIRLESKARAFPLVHISPQPEHNWPVSVYHLGEMLIQSCGQSVSAPRGKSGAMLNAHTELRAKPQRSAREAIYRNRHISH